ncbi:hypothetical protein DMUE_2916 [Dictyocoela muelleri]|nr:hypothetical protein DMUE_2916 [Dictyocoela muelleri]
MLFSKFIVSLLPILAKKFHLKIKSQCKFIGGTDKYLRAVNSSEADILSGDIKISNTIITVDTRGGKVFDIKMDEKRLIVWDKHGGTNQQFTFVINKFGISDQVMIKNQEMCLKYLEKENVFQLNTCNSDDINQIFEYRNYGNIECIRKTILNEEFLIRGNIPVRDLKVHIPRSYVNGLVSL